MNETIANTRTEYKDTKGFPGWPLVSVVIPCFNQGRFLDNAIQSLYRQTYPHIEIIVVNDGSTDDTETIASGLPKLKYINQTNQGLPNARNRGWRESSGDYVAFLDADDWLYPDAIEINLNALVNHPECAFSSGEFTEVHDHEKQQHNWDLVPAASQKKFATPSAFSESMYQYLLKGNCIGNPAAVLFTRWILEAIPFESHEEIKGCEDYDHYLQITREYPVFHHHAKISFYRKHSANMSNDSALMLESALAALQRQGTNLQNTEEKNAYEEGIRNWKIFYLNRFVNKNRNKIIRSFLSFGFFSDPDLNPTFIDRYRNQILEILRRKAVTKMKKTLIKTVG